MFGTRFTHTRSVILFALLFLFAFLPTSWRAPVRAQAVPIVYEHLNTEMELGEDGVLHVRVIQQIRFDGEFSGAFYAIPLQNITSVANVQLYDAATLQDNYQLDTLDLVPLAPNFIENDGNEVLIDWDFPRTRRGDVRLFVIEYDAYGVVWVYPEQDFVSWVAIGEDRSGVDVKASEVKLTLPEVIPMEQVTTTDNFGGDEISIAGQTITFVAGDPIPDGASYIVEAHFPHGLLDVNVQQWQRDFDGEALRVEIEQFHADLTLHADGTLDVQEETTLNVLDGALHQGFRALRLLYIDEAANPTVALNGEALPQGEGDCVGCFRVTEIQPRRWVYLDGENEQFTVNEDAAGEYNLDWYAPLPIEAGATVTTTTTFQVNGVLRVSPENQLFTWQLVPDFGQAVRRASLRLTLPPGVNAEQISIDAPAEQGAGQLEPDGSLYYQFDGPVAPGAWQIAVTLPADATRATVPQWQQEFEEVAAAADAAAVRRARMTLLTRVVGVLAVVGTLLAGVYAWFRWGRQKVKETLGGYLSEPPSQQSPAMVAYLVDRKASERGILGTIFYLAAFRILEIDLEGEIKLRRLRDEPLRGQARLTDVYGATATIPRHVSALFDLVLLPGLPHNEWATLDALAARLRSQLPEIYGQLAADVQKFFITIPGSKSDTGPGSLWFFIYAGLIGLIFFEIIPWSAGFVIGFIVIIAFVAWSAIRETSGGYTDAGALEADRWRRFKTYLVEIKKYGDQGAAQEIIDRYFGYAVALGVENLVLAQAAEMGNLRPIWMPSTHTDAPGEREPQRPARSSQGSWDNIPWPRTRPSTPPVPSNRPTLAGMSAQLGSSIRNASRSLGSLLSTAAGDAGSAPRSVLINSGLRRREMTWEPHTPVTKVLDDIMRQSVADAREIQAREIARRAAERSASNTSSGSWNWGGGGSSGSSSSSRSSSGFGRSSSSSSRSSSSRSSSSSSSSSRSSSSRSSGGGRSGFR